MLQNFHAFQNIVQENNSSHLRYKQRDISSGQTVPSWSRTYKEKKDEKQNKIKVDKDQDDFKLFTINI